VTFALGGGRTLTGTLNGSGQATATTAMLRLGHIRSQPPTAATPILPLRIPRR
jgi:hypothetical protein